MENFSELIKKRRSTRKFTDEELSQDEVVALLKAALMSPSSKRAKPAWSSSAAAEATAWKGLGLFRRYSISLWMVSIGVSPFSREHFLHHTTAAAKRKRRRGICGVSGNLFY